jgi:hypothetical protein
MALQQQEPARGTFEGLGKMHRQPLLHSHGYDDVGRALHRDGRTSLDPFLGMRLDIANPTRQQ